VKPSPYLISRRKAAHCLNQLCKQLNFGSKAEHFDPEDYKWWDNRGEHHVLAMRDKTIIAEIEFSEGTTRAYLTIPKWDGLIRTTHLSAFNPRDHGLIENTSEDVLFREQYPDSVGEVDFGEPPGLNLPPHPRVKETVYKQPRVVL
jgi:hypothetical protein